MLSGGPARALGPATPPLPEGAGLGDLADGGPGSRVTVASGLAAVSEILRRSYGPVRIDARGPRRGLRLEQASLGPVALDRVALTMEFDAVGTLPPTLVFAELASGRVRQRAQRRDGRYGPGDVFLAGQPGQPYAATARDPDTRLAIIDPALPAAVAGAAPGRKSGQVRFTGYDAVSAQAARQWAATVAYLRDHVLASPDAADAPLVTASAVRLLVATALATFPNDAQAEPDAADRHDGSPATLSRAVAYIDEHAHEDVTLADIAAHARVTVRAIQLAFRRHLDTTPSAYLRRVRLDRAHHQLLAADPDVDSVTAVSYQWGFASPSRFAAYYRTAYGVAPSSTLHR